jgi:hypothetical protein
MWDVLSADFEQSQKKDAWKCGFQYKTREYNCISWQRESIQNLEYTLPTSWII